MELPEPEPSSALVPDRFEDDAVALADLATEDEDPLPLDPSPTEGSDIEPVELGDLDDLTASAHAGTLSSVERELLEGVDTEDSEYTRARVLLYQDAKSRGASMEQRKHIEALMVLPENHYRPEYLVEEAQIALMDRDYDRALARAELAERHWARLPRDLVFSKRAAIFEIEAAAHTGLFYASDGEDMQALERAIRVWEKYKRHVLTRQRSDLQRHADSKIEKLADMRARIQ